MKTLKNTKGQMAVEMVLMLVLILGIVFAISQYFRQNQVVAQFVSGPWQALDGMVQAGVWAPANEALSQHPNLLSRHQSPMPLDVENNIIE